MALLRSARIARLPLSLLCLLSLAACVERRLTITTVPADADIFLDGQRVGQGPLTLPFTHYGTREVVVRRPGYRTERHLITMEPPYFQRFPSDFYYETLTSDLYVDERVWPFVLEPTTEEDLSRERVDEKVLEAKELRNR